MTNGSQFPVEVTAQAQLETMASEMNAVQQRFESQIRELERCLAREI